MDDPAIWAIIWLAIAALLGAAEILIAGSFFMLPFAVGALAAAMVSLFGGHFIIGWIVFLVVSFIAFLSLRPLAKRLDIKVPTINGVGAKRLIGAEGIVLEEIPAQPGQTGVVKIGGEEWRAQTDPPVTITTDSEVVVSHVQGTRVVVELKQENVY